MYSASTHITGSDGWLTTRQQRSYVRPNEGGNSDGDMNMYNSLFPVDHGVSALILTLTLTLAYRIRMHHNRDLDSRPGDKGALWTGLDTYVGQGTASSAGYI